MGVHAHTYVGVSVCVFVYPGVYMDACVCVEVWFVREFFVSELFLNVLDLIFLQRVKQFQILPANISIPIWY